MNAVLCGVAEGPVPIPDETTRPSTHPTDQRATAMSTGHDPAGFGGPLSARTTTTG